MTISLVIDPCVAFRVDGRPYLRQHSLPHDNGDFINALQTFLRP